jgi:CheY-like chemotaxis protein
MTPLKLLIVEDDLASLELMAEVFTSFRAEVRPVSDSEKAVGMVDQEKFDGIFLDLEMPKLNGFDLARLIRKSSWNKSTPIIIVTVCSPRTRCDCFFGPPFRGFPSM